MMSVESKQVRDGDEVRRWLEAGQTQLASLLELLEACGKVHQASTSRSTSSLRTWSGTSPSTSPP